MQNSVTVQIKAGQGSLGTFELRSLGIAFKGHAEARGAKCLAACTGDTLSLTIEGMTPDSIETLLSSFLESARQRGVMLCVLQRDVAPSPEGGFTGRAYQSGEIIYERLTRKFFFGLPKGVFLVSNIFGLDSRSVFAEQVGDLQSRTEAWERAAAAGAAQRNCHVVWTKDEFERASSGQL